MKSKNIIYAGILILVLGAITSESELISSNIKYIFGLLIIFVGIFKYIRYER